MGETFKRVELLSYDMYVFVFKRSREGGGLHFLGDLLLVIFVHNGECWLI